MDDHPITLFLDEIFDEISAYMSDIGEAKELSTTVNKYTQAVRNKDRTKRALILKPFGSDTGLIRTCLSHCDRLERTREKISDSASTLNDFIVSKELSCNKCMGTGVIRTPLYVRDKGSTRQRTFQVKDCPECGGKGKVKFTVNEECEALIMKFIKFTNSLDFILMNTIHCIRNLLNSL